MRDRFEVATPSFEAYRMFVRANTLQNDESDDRGSIAVCREALAIDPDFAAAWMLIGWGFNHLGQIDSSRVALEESLRRPERLTEVERLFAEAVVALYRNDLRAALAADDRLVREYPSSSAYANRGAVFAWMGRYEEDLRDQERAVRLEAFAPKQWILSNQFEDLLALGRLAEAEKVATRLKGSRGRLAALGLATAGANWVRAESCATALLNDPMTDGDVRVRAAIAVASEEAARGRLAASRRILDQAQEIAEAGSPTTLRREIERAKLLLMVAGGGTRQGSDLATARDTSVAGLLTRGLWAAVGGDVPRARQLLRRVQARPQAELARHGAGPVLLEAWIAARSSQWEEVVRLLGPAARQGVELGFVTDGCGRVPMRWLVAEAWEELGHPDSAAAFFELALSPQRMFWEERLPLRMTSSFAHLRLVMLYARMGRLEDAKRHWRIVSETVRTPDPEIRPLIEEARGVLTSAEGMAKSTRR
jgi:tetratricopeptide (TPR) repeat protein